jgi:hypothetical protein
VVGAGYALFRLPTDDLFLLLVVKAL